MPPSLKIVSRLFGGSSHKKQKKQQRGVVGNDSSSSIKGDRTRNSNSNTIRSSNTSNSIRRKINFNNNEDDNIKEEEEESPSQEDTIESITAEEVEEKEEDEKYKDKYQNEYDDEVSSRVDGNDETSQQESILKEVAVIPPRTVETAIAPLSSSMKRKIKKMLPMAAVNVATISNRNNKRSNMIPSSMLAPRHDDDDDNDNDDIVYEDDDDDDNDDRSIISGLTQVTTITSGQQSKLETMSILSTGSSNSTKRMEDFLKTENEAIRQLLLDADDDTETNSTSAFNNASGGGGGCGGGCGKDGIDVPISIVALSLLASEKEDGIISGLLERTNTGIERTVSESTFRERTGPAVDESVRGANEAEAMVKEMERVLKEFPTTNSKSSNSKDEQRHSSYPLPTFVDYTTSYPLPPSSEQQQSSIRPAPPLPPPSTVNVPIAAISPEASCDIRSVIHPPTSQQNNDNNNSCDDSRSQSISSTASRTSSHRSSSSSSRDLFRKQGSVYQLKGSNSNNKSNTRTRTATPNTRRSWRTTLIYILVFSFISCASIFMVHWKVCNSEKTFNDALQDSTKQFMHGIALTTKAVRTTKYYANEQIIEYYAPLTDKILQSSRRRTNSYLTTIMNDETKEKIMNSIQATKTYTLESITITDETKTNIVNSIHATKTYAVGSVTSSFDVIINKMIPMIAEGIAGFYLTFTNNNNGTTIFQIIIEYFQSTKTYLVDKFEYKFTDRMEREKRKLEEQEKIINELLAVAADATAKAEVAQQQMLTTTVFAGACAFLGSVATNYIWAAM